MGSVIALTDGAGVVQDSVAYDGFGNILSESNSSFGDRYKFTGQQLDSATGLQHQDHREYNPSTQRWMSQDSLGFAAGDANLYRYVANNSTSWIDPSGMDEIRDFIKGAGKALSSRTIVGSVLDGSLPEKLEGATIIGLGKQAKKMFDEKKKEGKSTGAAAAETAIRLGMSSRVSNTVDLLTKPTTTEEKGNLIGGMVIDTAQDVAIVIGAVPGRGAAPVQAEPGPISVAETGAPAAGPSAAPSAGVTVPPVAGATGGGCNRRRLFTAVLAWHVLPGQVAWEGKVTKHTEHRWRADDGPSCARRRTEHAARNSPVAT
jgi:RHS repeat-associated protein